MRLRTIRISLGAALVVVALASAPLVVAQTAAWLDQPPVVWNTPGQSAPPAAPAMNNVDPRCAEREDAPSSPEENQVTGRGWKLQGFWPTVRAGNLVLVTGLADYDGMCRPWNFNVFVFVDGRYAGTLSPELMNSRTDGQLQFRQDGTPATASAGGSIGADFVRYATTDPLCCPSGGTTHVAYQVRQVSAGPFVAATQIGAQGAGAGAPAQVPSRLPATGSASTDAPISLGLAGFGLLCLALGAVALRNPSLRRRSR